jgi:hypothetical protein
MSQDAERPPRSTSIAVGFVVLVAVAFVILRKPKPVSPVGPPSAGSVTSFNGNSAAADQLASAMAELEKLPIAEGPPLAKIQAALEGAGNADKGFKLSDGRDPPPLPSDAPRAIRIGLVLVRYQGAQLAPQEAPAREQALVRAQTLAALAKTDFAAAVKAGDFGSSLDVGRVERGLLEPGTQYVLFTMQPGAVSEVLDTPRGFWIVRRIR